ncbi:MAG: replication-associated recombination protein A [Rikenellaceae bacterium]|nr:replication-associated recombination protein A [Rikenellaceae bacterium]
MSAPLAERLRPQTLEDYIGQQHLVGEGGVFRRFIEAGNVPSFILWGPPGVGKTTLARIVANALERPFYTLSAVTSGVKEVRDVIESAKSQKFFSTKTPLLFIDEIHRFNKSQQDSLLGAVEQGIITLIGATTENPSFEVISPLLSRCQVYTLKPMQDEDLQRLLDRALTADEELKRRQIKVEESAALFRFAGGDARKLLNILDIITSSREGDLVITDDLVTEVLQQNIALYDKNGEQHYDVISAFIKSVRGSDPNAAIYYLARMLAGGEEPRFIARRLVILASEDIGLANPNALLLANACFDTVHKIGMPEARITLAETTIYLATSQKSNSAYMAINEALAFVQKDTNLRPVPLHLRNAVTDLMAEQGYGDGYKYAHDYEGNFVEQEFMPESLKGKQFYHPNTGNQTEQRIAERLKMLWNNKYE